MLKQCLQQRFIINIFWKLYRCFTTAYKNPSASACETQKPCSSPFFLFTYCKVIHSIFCFYWSRGSLQSLLLLHFLRTVMPYTSWRLYFSVANNSKWREIVSKTDLSTCTTIICSAFFFSKGNIRLLWLVNKVCSVTTEDFIFFPPPRPPFFFFFFFLSIPLCVWRVALEYCTCHPSFLHFFQLSTQPKMWVIWFFGWFKLWEAFELSLTREKRSLFLSSS